MQKKIEQEELYIKEYNDAIVRGYKLLDALEDYTKDTINKTFFEKYFTSKYTSEWKELPQGVKVGDVRKDWKGKIYTEFSLSDSQFSFQKPFRIFLANSQYIEDIENRNRSHIIEKTKEKIDLLKSWRDNCIVKRDKYKNFKVEEFKKDYKKLVDAYNMQGESHVLCEIVRFVD